MFCKSMIEFLDRYRTEMFDLRFVRIIYSTDHLTLVFLFSLNIKLHGRNCVPKILCARRSNPCGSENN